jgi:5-formyltetrahydrofolate cyclo-ligase
MLNKNNANIKQKNAIRKMMNLKRQALSLSYKNQKSRELQKTLLGLKDLQKAERIAFYWPSKGEIDPTPFLEICLERKKRCYLPVLHPSKEKHLLFQEYQQGDPLHLNRFGISEPPLSTHSTLAPWMLDIVFVPLMGFTKTGQRLGRGGGYYDKTFDFPEHPKLIGLAYEFQELDHLPHDEWDLLLSGVVTEKRIILF